MWKRDLRAGTVNVLVCHVTMAAATRADSGGAKDPSLDLFLDVGGSQLLFLRGSHLVGAYAAAPDGIAAQGDFKIGCHLTVERLPYSSQVIGVKAEGGRFYLIRSFLCRQEIRDLIQDGELVRGSLANLDYHIRSLVKQREPSRSAHQRPGEPILIFGRTVL